MIRATRSDTLLELLLELESKADELESKEELNPDPPKPPELNPDPPELNPDPLDPRLAKLVGGALLEESGSPRVEVDPKSKLDESKEFSLCCCWAELPKLEADSKLEKSCWLEPNVPWLETMSPEPFDEATAV